MRMVRLKKGHLAALMALVLTVSCVCVTSVNAADAIDTAAKCSLTLTVPSDSAYYKDTAKPAITAKIYKVASVSAARDFTAIGDYGVDIPTLVKQNDTDAWAAAAVTAAGTLSDKTAVAEVPLKAGAGTTVISGKAENLETGMYLVEMDSVNSPEYTYSFTPYFISLPNNLYYSTGKTTDDKWIYDAASDIKIGQEQRFGSLEIVKTLDTYNSTFGKTTFVFRIEGTRNGATYSNVVSIDFTAAGQQTQKIDNLPAGMDVTVTEVYSGASYKLTTDETKTVKIIADGEEGAPVKAEFTNTYSNETKHGYGVANHFNYNDGDWSWSQSGSDS